MLQELPTVGTGTFRKRRHKSRGGHTTDCIFWDARFLERDLRPHRLPCHSPKHLPRRERHYGESTASTCNPSSVPKRSQVQVKYKRGKTDCSSADVARQLLVPAFGRVHSSGLQVPPVSDRPGGTPPARGWGTAIPQGETAAPQAAPGQGRPLAAARGRAGARGPAASWGGPGWTRRQGRETRAPFGEAGSPGRALALKQQAASSTALVI